MTLRELVERLGAARIAVGDPGSTVESLAVATSLAEAPPGGVAVVEAEPSRRGERPTVWADAGLDAAAAELAGLEAAHPLVRFRLGWRKLVAFVPEAQLEAVRAGLFAAGAGRIGEYEHCAFELRGSGSFRGLERSRPVVGSPGVEERVDEVRLEAVYPAWAEWAVVSALVAAHPYEEPAFDLYPLANVAPRHGRGRVGLLDGEPVAVWLGESTDLEEQARLRGARRLALEPALAARARALAGERLAGLLELPLMVGEAAQAVEVAAAVKESAPAATAAGVVVRVDGGSRGNPGPAAIGYLIEAPDGSVLVEHGETIGRATNNVAEYRALIAALRAARAQGARSVEVRADSELLVRQMTGVYRVKHDGLRALWDEAQSAADAFERVRYRSVPRAENAAADRLVNEALDSSAG